MLLGLFRNLCKLELWNKDNRWGSHDSFQFSACSNTVRQLMANSELDYLLLYKVDTFDDQLFEDMAAKNRLGRLKNVVLDHCHAFTSATIWKVSLTNQGMKGALN